MWVESIVCNISVVFWDTVYNLTAGSMLPLLFARHGVTTSNRALPSVQSQIIVLLSTEKS